MAYGRSGGGDDGVESLRHGNRAAGNGSVRRPSCERSYVASSANWRCHAFACNGDTAGGAAAGSEVEIRCVKTHMSAVSELLVDNTGAVAGSRVKVRGATGMTLGMAE